MNFRGHVIYPEANVDVLDSAVDRKFIDNLAALIKRLASVTPVRRVASAAECRFCDITGQDCPDRIEDEDAAEGDTADF